MNTRLRALLTLTVVAVVAALAVPRAGLAVSAEPETEDVIFMVDGRELHGHIIKETSTRIVFEFVDRKLKLRTKLTLALDDIAHIERDVTIEEAVKAGPAPRRKTKSNASTAPDRTGWGRSRLDRDDESAPAFYLIPITGQMGTDVHVSIYEDVVEHARKLNPDVIVYILDCKDYDDVMLPPNDENEVGLLLTDEYRKVVKLLQDELSDIRQVMWVKDSVGFSSMLALAWRELYMTPSARLDGLRRVVDETGADKWSDKDIRAKMSAFVTASVQAFLERGDRAVELGDAMLWPEEKLSASFWGREVKWSLTDQGEFLVDNDKEATVSFRAKAAEDLGISDGTVENLDDLAFLLGYREYRVVSDEDESLVSDYIEDWRRTFENTKTWWGDYFQHIGWASGDEALKWLGQAKSDVKKIIRAMERYKAVEIRMATDFGVRKQELEILVEQLKEQIRALKEGGAGRGTGRRSRGTGIGG